jgi:hypothetical protein
MSKGAATRFTKGRSGNPAGRPKKQAPYISAFEVIYDQSLTVTQGGAERELTVDEGLQLQTYQAALKGSRMAVRAILKMIAKREAWLAAKDPPTHTPVKVKSTHEGRTADQALLILGIATEEVPPERFGPAREPLLKLQPWVVQEALRRSKRRTISERDIQEIRRQTQDPEKVSWP